MSKSGRLKSRIKKDDEVIVIAGKSKGQRGKVLKVAADSDKHIRILVEGVNMVKKAVRPNPNKGEQGGIKEKEAFIDISNVKLFNHVENRGERVGYRFLKDGKKVRYFKSSDELVDAE